MKNLKYLSLCLAILATVSCKKQKQENEMEMLQIQFAEIKALSESIDCSDASNWSFTAYGNKSCGGSVGYIAYSNTIEKEFLDKVKTYTADQIEFNKKWDTFSDCSVPLQPNFIECIDGEAVLVY